MSDGGYHRLEVYREAHALAVRIHTMTLSLPRTEAFEEGSQVRRSSKRVSASIVEGYAQRKHKALFLSYLYRALGSADETQEHLRFLMETGSLKDLKGGAALLQAAEELSRRMTRFIQGTEREHEPRPLLMVAPDPAPFRRKTSDLRHRTSDIRHPASRPKPRKAKG